MGVARGRGRGRGRSESGRSTTATTRRGRGTIGPTTTTTTTATRGREGISTGAIHRRSAATSSTRGGSVVDSRRSRSHDRNTSRATNARPAGGGQQEQQVLVRTQQFFNQMISRIERNNDAARIALASLGPWTPIITEDLPELSLELAREALQSFGNAQQNDRHHSRFFVPFLCAVQGLFHSQLDFVRRFIGVNNWNILVVRTIFVFRAAGITSENTPWGRFQAAAGQGDHDFYVNENIQLALLWVESRMATNVLWNQMSSEVTAEELFDETAGGRFMASIGMQLGQAEILLQNHHQQQLQQHPRRSVD